jgi:FkbM family methyltransferase
VLALRAKLAPLRRRVLEHQLPKVFTLTDLDTGGVSFEATNVVERSRIVAYGEEPEYLRAMLETLRPEDVLYDIGANIGLVALHAARICRTLAFEPDPSFFARLERNLELNPSRSVAAHPIAIGDVDGTATLFTDGAHGRSPSLVHHGENGTVEVLVQTLDTLAARAELPAPSVLKLDIEGAEILALRGARHVLSSRTAPRALFLEVHDSLLPAFGSSAEEVLSMLRATGYGIVRYHAQRADQQHLILERS